MPRTVKPSQRTSPPNKGRGTNPSKAAAPKSGPRAPKVNTNPTKGGSYNNDPHNGLGSRSK
jgi:hypothetical protein